MRWAMVLGWLLAAAAVRAEAPMDLDSPFLKTALIEGRDGQLEERVIRKAKAAGDSLEMETENGGMALFPQADVKAILPRLPEQTADFETGDLEKAIRFLQDLPSPWRERPEAAPEMLEKWRAMLPKAAEKDVERAEKEKEEEEQKKEADAAEVAGWVADWSDFRKSRTSEEIRKLRVQGEELRKTAPREAERVEEGMVFLAQWQARPGASPLADLEKLESIQAAMEPEDLLAWTGGGLLGVSFFALLMGLSFVSSGLTRFKDGAWLGGIVFLPMGLALLGGLGAVWWPGGGAGNEVEPGLSAGMERLVLAAKNSVQPIGYFPSFAEEVDGAAVVAGLLAAVAPAEEPTGFLKARFQAGSCWLGEGGWTFRQPLTMIGLPLPLAFTFAGQTPPLNGWRQPTAQKLWLGSVPLPSGLGEMFFQSVVASWGQAAERVGLGRLKLEEGQGGKIRMVVPPSGKRPELAQATKYRKEISSEELAQAFVDGHGKEFVGKFVLLDGVVEKVESGGELSGGVSATAGIGLGGEAKVMGDSLTFDIFFLRGLPSHGVRKDPLLIRCLLKSSKVFVMDSRGDIYEGPKANITQSEPIVKKGQRVKFLREGRVEAAEIQNNQIEVYGIRLDDVADLQAYDPSQPVAP